MSAREPAADVVVVGLGATGAIAALQLAKAGMKVVALEAGPWRGIKDFGMDEIAHDVRNVLGNPKWNREIPTTRAKRSDVAKRTPTSGVLPMMNGVGGASVHYTAKSWRFLPWNFRMRSETIKRYGRSALPKGSLVEDWPFSYDDLEPYYDKVEYLLGVSGQAGNINGHRDPRGNHFEGPRARGYPMPPLRRSGWTRAADHAARRLGWHPYPGPAAINSQAYDGRPGCEYCGFCTGNGCHTNAKGSTFLNAIPQAQRTGNLEVRTGARATRITVDADGRANGVDYLVGREQHHQPAKLVILSSYLYENIRLLLLSKSKAYPRGLSNNHGQVGLGFFPQAFHYSYGLFDHRLNRFGPSGEHTAIDDFDADNFDHTGLGFIGGGSIHASMEAKPISSARGTPPDVPKWGSQWKRWAAKNALATGPLYTQMDTLPYEDQFVDLDPTHKDPHGFPLARVTWTMTPEALRRADFLARKQERLLRAMGAIKVWRSPSYVPVNQHAYGGARMGSDPDHFVLDRWGLSHEVPNLAVLGGAGALSCGGRNPTQTLQAMAWRTSDRIVGHWSTLTGS